MDIRIEPDEAAVARLAADFVEAALTADRPTIGLATGATPVPTYTELIRRHREHNLRLDHATYVLLDEYVGLPLDHPASCRGFIREVFTDHAGIPPASIHGPATDATTLSGAGARYEQLLADLPPRRLQVLGIGRNGHIGFNEPSSSLASRTRVKTLCAETRADARNLFHDETDVPASGLTMGIGTILEAHQLLLLATGEAKVDAVTAAMEGPLTSMVPASALQLHPRATVILDEAAAAGLALRDYYRESAPSRAPG